MQSTRSPRGPQSRQSPQVLYKLAKRHLFAKPGTRDAPLALRCLRRAAAQYNLGVLYAEGRGVKKSLRRAMFWFLRAARNGDPLAQFNCGLTYDMGEGVARDAREAVAWYRKAAARGDAWAQCNLGAMY